MMFLLVILTIFCAYMTIRMYDDNSPEGGKYPSGRNTVYRNKDGRPITKSIHLFELLGGLSLCTFLTIAIIKTRNGQDVSLLDPVVLLVSALIVLSLGMSMAGRTAVHNAGFKDEPQEDYKSTEAEVTPELEEFQRAIKIGMVPYFAMRYNIPEEVVARWKHTFNDDILQYFQGANYVLEEVQKLGIDWSKVVDNGHVMTDLHPDINKIRTDMFGNSLLNAIKNTFLRVETPDDIRSEHHMIVAGTGHGKTQCLQEMIYKDISTGAPIIVIDSQGGMLERLLHVIPEDRIAYLDGSSPLALSPFEIGSTRDDAKVTMALDLFENMFAALETQMTTKQATLYRYLSRLLMEIPAATFETALDILANGTVGYEEYIRKLPAIPQRFFEQQFMDRSYGETKRQIGERLFTLLENQAIGRMFNAPAGKVDIDQEIRERKVILINTAQSTLGTKGAAIFGRYALLQVALEVLSRPETTDRVYFYIDEAQEYLTDSPIINRLFEQGRKRGLCMIVAFHRLGQLPGDLADAMRSLTSVKFVGGVNATDAAVLARDMQVRPEDLQSVPKLSFISYFKGKPSGKTFQVDAGLVERQSKRPAHAIAAIKRRMHERYAYQPQKTSQNVRDDFIDPNAPQDLD